MAINQITVDGNVVRDAEVRFATSGVAVCTFSIAHNRKVKDKDEVHYFDVTALGKLGEKTADRAKKGERAVVVGMLQQRKWEKDGKDYSKVIVLADHVFIQMKDAAPAEAAAPPPDEDIPF